MKEKFLIFILLISDVVLSSLILKCSIDWKTISDADNCNVKNSDIEKCDINTCQYWNKVEYEN